MSDFGELNFESSRALADDEGDEGEFGEMGLSIEWTKEGEEYVQSASEGSHVFCAFTGKVAVGFGEGFLTGNTDLKSQENFTLLGQIFLTGNEGTIDICSVRPRRKSYVRIYLGGNKEKNPVVFAFINFYGVQRILSNYLAEMISKLIESASKVVVFHSEASAYNRGEEVTEGKLFYLTTSVAAKQSAPASWSLLQPPNIVSGPSAALLIRCEMLEKSAVMLATYCETELVDSISIKPFLQAVHTKSSSSSSVFNLPKIFTQFQHNLDHSAKSLSNPVVGSNLYA